MERYLRSLIWSLASLKAIFCFLGFRCYDSGHDEVCKGLGGFLNLWIATANDDFSGEFRRKNEPVSQYWRGVKAALDLPLPIEVFERWFLAKNKVYS